MQVSNHQLDLKPLLLNIRSQLSAPLCPLPLVLEPGQLNQWLPLLGKRGKLAPDPDMELRALMSLPMRNILLSLSLSVMALDLMDKWVMGHQ